jgi:hypothetical protein
VLTGNEYFWENKSSKYRLAAGGKNSKGETLYICRVRVSGTMIPGKLENGRCYVPYGGIEESSGNWETLKQYS